MRAKRFRWLVAIALVCACGALAAAIADRGERIVQVDLDCVEDGCRVLADGAEFWIDAPAATRGRQVGLYAYQPHEFPGRPTFRGLRIQPERGVPVAHSLLDAAGTPPEWRSAAGFESVPGRGLESRLEPGGRATLLLSGEYRNYRLTVEIVEPVDVGILFGAQDDGTGTVFVVRPHYNDALLFPLRDGRAGAVLALEPLTDLRVPREALRLMGLVCRIALPGLLMALLLLAWTAGVGLPRQPATNEPGQSMVVPVLLGSVILIACSAIALGALKSIPHIADETAYLFQARIFAGGEPWATPPVLPDFFLHEHIILAPDRWFAKYPPLFPALLAVGVAAGVPWIVNPLLGALLGVATYLLARELSDRRWAALAGALVATSPFLLVMNGTMMSHSVTGLLITVALWLTIRAVRSSSIRVAVPAGLALGAAALARPYTAFLVALAIGGWLGVCCLRSPHRRKTIAVAATVVLCALPALGVFVAWNTAYTGGGGLSYAAYQSNDTLGFGPEHGTGWLKTWGTWGHTPAKALRSMHQYLDYFSRDLLGWPGRLSLVVLVAGLALGLRRSVRRRDEALPDPGALLLAVFGVLALGHTLYWATQHIGYGARYWFEAAPALIVLVTLSLRAVCGRIDLRAGLAGPFRMHPVGVLVAGLMLFNLVSYLPGRIAELPHYGGIGPGLKHEVERRGLTDAVVFVQTQGLLYNDGFFMNDPLELTYPIFARDLGPRNQELLRRHPGRPAYRWDGERLWELLDPAAASGRSRGDIGP